MSSSQRFWVDWFRQANVLAKYASAMDQRAAIEASKNSGFYPRDIIIKAMRGRLYWWTTPDGFKWYPMAAVTDISDALDVVSQRIGSVLVRAADRWRDAVPGAAGDVLTHQGEDAAPLWSPISAGNGAIQEVVPGTPIIFDNTKTSYELLIEPYSEVLITMSEGVLSAADSFGIRYSVDGGISYKAGGTDYFTFVSTNGLNHYNQRTDIIINAGTAASEHWNQINIKNIRIGQTALFGMASRSVASGGSVAGRALFDGPVTHLKLFTLGGVLFKTGEVKAIGTRA